MAVTLSTKWLEELLNIELDESHLVTQLSERGLEAELLPTTHTSITNVVVGQIIDYQKHPNADKLNLCQVDIGQKETLKIVCGCPSVQKGMKVPVALVGATLPEIKIKQSKIRGEESFGMLCTAFELGLSSVKSPLLQLEQNSLLGQNIIETLNLDTNWILIEVTPNRGDCLSAIGVAREVAALYDAKQPILDSIQEVMFKESKIINDKRCSSYYCATLSNISFDCKLPFEMEYRLQAADIHRVNCIVDILNYVTLLTGQPMHAFDLDQLEGPIQVRTAIKGEDIELLNQSTLNLEDQLVIADSKKPIALAGIIGGQDSSVTEVTKSILIESASFNDVYISKQSHKLQLHTDASYRYARQTDLEMAKKALQIAIQFIQKIVGGQLNSVSCDKIMTPTKTISIEVDKFNQVLGTSIAEPEIKNLLKKINIESINEKTEKGILDFKIPSYRNDLNDPIDLVEEVARMYGFNNIPQSQLILPPIDQEDVHLSTQQKIANVLTAKGYNELKSYGLISKQLASYFCKDDEMIEIQNHLSEEHAILRPTILSGLIDQIIYCQNHDFSLIKTFEIGKCFQRSQHEKNQLGIAIYGNQGHEYPDNKKPLTFYDAVGDLIAMLHNVMPTGDIHISRDASQCPKYLHPGKSAQILIHDNPVGWIGSFQPNIQKLFQKPLFVAEIQLNKLYEIELNKVNLKQRSKYQASTRDFSCWLENDHSDALIKNTILKNSPLEVRDCFLVDRYLDDNTNKISHTYRVIFQSSQKTLKDKEIQNACENITSALKSIGIVLREGNEHIN